LVYTALLSSKTTVSLLDVLNAIGNMSV
jgi:hypothetical protein